MEITVKKFDFVKGTVKETVRTVPGEIETPLLKILKKTIRKPEQ
jgi:hypothetical protein